MRIELYASIGLAEGVQPDGRLYVGEEQAEIPEDLSGISGKRFRRPVSR